MRKYISTIILGATLLNTPTFAGYTDDFLETFDRGNYRAAAALASKGAQPYLDLAAQTELGIQRQVGNDLRDLSLLLERGESAVGNPELIRRLRSNLERLRDTGSLLEDFIPELGDQITHEVKLAMQQQAPQLDTRLSDALLAQQLAEEEEDALALRMSDHHLAEHVQREYDAAYANVRAILDHPHQQADAVRHPAAAAAAPAAGKRTDIEAVGPYVAIMNRAKTLFEEAKPRGIEELQEALETYRGMLVPGIHPDQERMARSRISEIEAEIIQVQSFDENKQQNIQRIFDQLRLEFEAIYPEELARAIEDIAPEDQEED